MCCFYIRKCSKFFEQCNLKELIATCILNIISGLRVAVVVSNIKASDAGLGGGRQGPIQHPQTFLHSKKKKRENKGKEETFSKQKLLKGCHQGQSVTHFANLEHLEFKKFKTCFIILFHYFVCLLENGSWWCIGDVPKICSEVQYLLQSIHWRWGQ